MTKEITSLLDDIDKYDSAYYNDNTKLISDEEYDGLKDKLRAIKPPKEDKELSVRIKTTLARVGAPPPKHGKWAKYNHEVPMSSLNKVNLPEELENWANKCNAKKEFLVLDKLDGISISLKYENGILVNGSTRGDGSVGENITVNVKKMKGVQNKLPEPLTSHIRGEIVLRHSDWKKYFPDLKNPRNSASGIAKRIDGTGVEHLSVIVYTIEGKDFNYENESMDYLKKLGFTVPNYFKVNSIKDIVSLWNKYMSQTRDSLDYDIDGLVVHINDRSHRFSLGEENHRPKGSVAFKFESPEARSVITNIICQVGDTGVITPVAEFNEVELLGATIKRASLHNFHKVEELCVNIGAEVIIERCNDVIPGIKEVVRKNNGAFQPPDKCPVCGAITVTDGKFVYCSNEKTCPPQVKGRINKWVNEHGILEWGDAVITKLIESGKVKDIGDLYRLTASDIASLDRMGDKSASNLIEELDKYRSVTLESFLGGLCIRGIATSIAKAVVDAGYDSLDDIMSVSVCELEQIPGFGYDRATAFYNGIIKNTDRINDILNAGLTIKARIKGSLTGKSVCFTGTMEQPRALLQKMVEENGGEVKKSVGKGTTYLVISDPNSNSSKAQAARKLGTILISEKQFLDMIKSGT